MWVCLYSFSRCCLPDMPTSTKFRENWTYSSSRSSKVDDFGTNRKHIYEFLLVINSNCVHLSPFLRYGDLSFSAKKCYNSCCGRSGHKVFQHRPTWPRYLNVTDWQTDGRTNIGVWGRGLGGRSPQTRAKPRFLWQKLNFSGGSQQPKMKKMYLLTEKCNSLCLPR